VSNTGQTRLRGADEYVVKGPFERCLSRIRNGNKRNLGCSHQSRTSASNVSKTHRESTQLWSQPMDVAELGVVGAKTLSVKKYSPQRRREWGVWSGGVETRELREK
jgi:hypothetical protein